MVSVFPEHNVSHFRFRLDVSRWRTLLTVLSGAGQLLSAKAVALGTHHIRLIVLEMVGRISLIEVALLMAWMPIPTASQCAIVVSVKAIIKGGSIHVRSYSHRYSPGKACFLAARRAQ